MILKTFDEAWAEMTRQGHDYGDDALEQVRFGWRLAMMAMLEAQLKEYQATRKQLDNTKG